MGKRDKERLNKLGHAVLHNFDKGENVNISDLDDVTFEHVCQFVDDVVGVAVDKKKR